MTRNYFLKKKGLIQFLYFYIYKISIKLIHESNPTI